jgi:hypothetical protein
MILGFFKGLGLRFIFGLISFFHIGFEVQLFSCCVNVRFRV